MTTERKEHPDPLKPVMAAMSKTWVDKYFDVNDLRTAERTLLIA